METVPDVQIYPFFINSFNERMESDLILEKVKRMFIGLVRDPEFANFPNSIEKVVKCRAWFGFSNPDLECGCS